MTNEPNARLGGGRRDQTQADSSVRGDARQHPDGGGGGDGERECPGAIHDASLHPGRPPSSHQKGYRRDTIRLNASASA